MKGEHPATPPPKPESTAYITVQGKKGTPTVKVGQSVEATVHGTVKRVSMDQDGYTCDLAVKSVEFTKAKSSTMGEDMKAVKSGKKDEDAEDD